MGWFAWLPWPGRGLFDCSEISADRRSLCEAKSLERCSDCVISRVVWEKIESVIGACKFITIYLGNGSEKSKLTIKAHLLSGRDVIVKLGNTRAAADAIRNEWEVLKKLQASGFELRVPTVIGEVGCEGEWTWSVQTVLPRGRSPNRLQKEHFEFLEKLKAVGVSHGDFTPWNCSIVCRSLVVWDWEDAGPFVNGKDIDWFRKQVRELLGDRA